MDNYHKGRHRVCKLLAELCTHAYICGNCPLTPRLVLLMYKQNKQLSIGIGYKFSVILFPAFYINESLLYINGYG